MKKLTKGLLITGGLFVLSEICGAIGEVQMLFAMQDINAEAVDEMLDTLRKADEFKGEIGIYTRKKAKLVGRMAEHFINNM